jgi:hypothetical protein
MRALVLRVWIGELPPWMDEWRRNVGGLRRYGFDFRVFNDYEMVKDRCTRVMGITLPSYEAMANTRKGVAGPCYGELFAEELQGYGFWGHCDQDTVFGRLDRFVSDEFMDDCDVFGNDPDAICGPFSLYRNCGAVNALYRRIPDWERLYSVPGYADIEEVPFTEVVRRAAQAKEIRFKSAFWQAHDNQPRHKPEPRLKLLEDGTLMDAVAAQEIMMFHFRRTKRWPL